MNGSLLAYHNKQYMMCIVDVVAGACYLCWLLQGLCGEGEMATLVQVVVVHALGDLGNGIVA